MTMVSLNRTTSISKTQMTGNNLCVSLSMGEVIPLVGFESSAGRLTWSFKNQSPRRQCNYRRRLFGFPDVICSPSNVSNARGPLVFDVVGAEIDGMRYNSLVSER